ncbi:hypothetical protein GCM10011571_07590 [Marinithermofilum abyssi]|uniref:Uncharacterized protein n=1 Tax=Marinithermofilum abyssi TaxID=1571185 RepID=A0A8J2VFG6_9BACL|nr:hypothetical protein GCM10011571_07590 [Marinithermofilum abyssi]
MEKPSKTLAVPRISGGFCGLLPIPMFPNYLCFTHYLLKAVSTDVDITYVIAIQVYDYGSL